MRALRWWSLLLVPGGFVAGHTLGYQGAATLGASPPAGGGHGYLSLLVLVGVPFACAALARTFLAGLRSQLPPVRLRTLAGAQVGLFLAVELGEHAVLGLDPVATLGEPAVLLGLVAQPGVATLLYLIVRSTHDVGVAVAAAVRRRPVTAARPLWQPATGHLLVPAPAVARVTTRGPPRPGPAAGRRRGRHRSV